MQDLRPSAESTEEADAGHEGPLQELRRHQVENGTMREWMKARCIPRMNICELIVLPKDVDPRDVTFYLIPVVQEKEEEEK